MPYLPVTPWLLPLPRPAKLSIHFGEPIRLDGGGAEDDLSAQRSVAQVKQRIAQLIERARP
jgi:hypothetical protein